MTTSKGEPTAAETYLQKYCDANQPSLEFVRDEILAKVEVVVDSLRKIEQAEDTHPAQKDALHTLVAQWEMTQTPLGSLAAKAFLHPQFITLILMSPFINIEQQTVQQGLDSALHLWNNLDKETLFKLFAMLREFRDALQIPAVKRLVDELGGIKGPDWMDHIRSVIPDMTHSTPPVEDA